MMLQVMDEVINKKQKASIIFIDKELTEFDIIKNANYLTKYLKEKIRREEQNYLFLDEDREIEEFEK